MSNGYDDTTEESSGNYGDKPTCTIKVKALYDQARAISPRLKSGTDHALGRFLKDQGYDNKQKVLRHRGWTFPPLRTAH